ncbi:squalene/phytoene synthase family protein [Streptomyces sp. W16]|uniref:phytoene/squalene synthase family protein n=1 Tax=Streptomyces sp. W16 TaxID=3076631 RepID=UPI00295C1D5D|nr:squalene/phytoene synthase family protein [Streptomyces sp. W16]MDV9170082.1 squalene/phytoene synthase family protein [Streptomyces sp. W16]
MTGWPTALTKAGIADPRLRRAYDAQRGIVRRYALHEYVAVRLLLPAELHPPVVAAVAYMHATDELIDTGAVDERTAALAAWDAETTAALESGEPPAQDGLLVLWDTVRRHPHMAARVRDFLDGAPVDARWTGFETEADFQTYVDSYSLPGLMLTASLLAPADSDAYESYLKGCRDLIEGWQRSDFLADLREDAENDRIGIPRDELARHGLKFEDLRSRSEECVPALDRVVREQAGLAGTTLAGCRTLPELVAAEHRPFLDALIAVQELRLGAVRRAGGKVLLHDTGPATFATLRVLARQYRRARRYA